MIWKTVRELAPLLKARKVSPVEVTRAYLARIESANPRVNAYLTVTEERALAAAREAEQEIGRGRYRGPLHGVPYAVKDLIATKGVRTTNGSRVTADWVPDFESTVTERLNGAGAIPLGKLNMLEFAMGSGQKGLQGPARNPWDLRYSPSGSSSGSGAALAAGMAALTVGSDTGGSIRGPAKSCGVAGLKPTYGRVSLHGVTTLSWTLDHVGPMGRSVEDVARMLQVMAGADARDRAASGKAVPDFGRQMLGGLKGLRLGVPVSYFFDKVAPETDAALRKAIGVLRDLGMALVDVKVKHAEMVGPASSMILSTEGAAFHQRRLKEKGDLMDPLVRERLEAATFHSAIDYIQALRVRTVLTEEMRRVFTTCDVLMLPAGNAAPLLEQEIVGTDIPPDPPPPGRPDVMNLANVTGIPALVVPCGMTAGPPALPLGSQFCGRPFAEGTLFRVGRAYQEVTDWHRRHPE